MRDSFILYTEYARHIELLSMEQRGVLLTAIFAYQTEDDLPEMDAVTEMAFAFISAQLERDNLRYDETCKKRSEAGKQGGAPKGNKNASKKAKQANAFQDKQNQANQTKQADNEDDNEDEYDITPPISPQAGDEGKDREKFFQTYPKLKSLKNFDDSRIDYKSLLISFERSDFLRKRFSVKWVYENYDAIIAGEYSDKKMALDSRTEQEKAADERSKRERFYSKRRNAALKTAEAYLAKVENDPEFKGAMDAIRRNEIELARAEIFHPERVTEIQQRIADGWRAIDSALARLGISREEIKPKFICTKCEDTGFLPDGRMCDCYEEAIT